MQTQGIWIYQINHFVPKWVFTWQTFTCCDPNHSQRPRSKTKRWFSALISLFGYLFYLCLTFQHGSLKNGFFLTFSHGHYRMKFLFLHWLIPSGTLKVLFDTNTFPPIYQWQNNKGPKTICADIFCHRVHQRWCVTRNCDYFCFTLTDQKRRMY